MRSALAGAQQGESVERLRELDHAPRQIFGNCQSDDVRFGRNRIQDPGDLGKAHTSSGHAFERIRRDGRVAEQQEVVMGGIQHVDIEVNRHPLAARGSQPGEDRFSGYRKLLRAKMSKPMLCDEARLERRRLGQSDIQNAAWV